MSSRSRTREVDTGQHPRRKLRKPVSRDAATAPAEAETTSVALSPDTVIRVEPRPRYRPQRIAVPESSRSIFYAATLAGIAAFAVFGVFNSLVPSFLAGTLHEQSHAIAGVVPFAAFAGGAVAQIISARTPSLALLGRSVPIIVVGTALTAGAMWSANLAMVVFAALAAVAIAGSVRAVTQRPLRATAGPGQQSSDYTATGVPIPVESLR
jgi:hypothetical protein